MNTLLKIEKKNEIYNINVSKQYQIAVNREVLEKMKTVLSNLKYSMYNNKQYYSFVSLGYCQNTYIVTLECSNIEICPNKFQAYIQIRLSPIINIKNTTSDITLSQHDITALMIDEIIEDINIIKEN